MGWELVYVSSLLRLLLSTTVTDVLDDIVLSNYETFCSQMTGLLPYNHRSSYREVLQ